MAKDPAFKFYTSDFLTGTVFLTDEQVGIYVRLLCAQHQHGGLIKKSVFNAAIKEHDILREKFIETEDGLFNPRLMEEMKKREVKSTNLSNNAKKRWDEYRAMQKHSKCNASAMHTELEPEPIVYKRPTVADINTYIQDNKYSVNAQAFFDFYESKGWMIGKNKMKNWQAAVRTWQKNTITKPEGSHYV
jgi:uncharacterized protein YdaU (DUF1376 family)